MIRLDMFYIKRMVVNFFVFVLVLLLLPRAYGQLVEFHPLFFEDYNGQPGQMVIGKPYPTFKVGETFFLMVMVKEYDPIRVGLSGGSDIYFAWDPLYIRNVNKPFYLKEIITENWPVWQSGFLDNEDGEIMGLGGMKLLGSGRPIGNLWPERIFLFKFKALKSTPSTNIAMTLASVMLGSSTPSSSQIKFMDANIAIVDPVGCVNECSVKNSTQCDSKSVAQTCLDDADADSCMEWKPVACNSNDICSRGKCIPKKLIAHWKFEGNTKNAVNGMETPSNLPYKKGVAGQAIEFDSIKNISRILASGEDMYEQTISLWFYIYPQRSNELDYGPYLFSTTNSDLWCGKFYLRCANKPCSAMTYGISKEDTYGEGSKKDGDYYEDATWTDIYTGGPKKDGDYYRGGPNRISIGVSSVTSNEILSSNKWHHAVGVFDGKSTTLYIDGKKVGSSAAANGEPIVSCLNPLHPGSSTFYTIGGKNVYGNELPLIFNAYDEFKGMIDELKIWNRVLSEAEIKNEYESIVGRCIDDCPVPGAAQCTIGGVPQVCASDVDTDSCLEWKDLPTCSAGKVCSGGSCITPVEELLVDFVLYKDNDGTKGEVIRDNAVSVGEPFFVDIMVQDNRSSSKGLKSLSLDISWDKGGLRDVTDWPIGLFREPNEIVLPIPFTDCNILTCSFPSERFSDDRTGRATGYRITHVLGGVSSPATGTGKAIGVGQYERFATLKFKALAKSNGAFIYAKLSNRESFISTKPIITSFVDGKTPRSVREPFVDIKVADAPYSKYKCVPGCIRAWEQRCVDWTGTPGAREVCWVNAEKDYCNEWRALPSCQDGEKCLFGDCYPICINRCVLGEKQCLYNPSTARTGILQECMRNADTGCLGWQELTPCQDGKICREGSCIATMGNDLYIDFVLRKYNYHNGTKGEVIRDNAVSVGEPFFVDIMVQDIRSSSKGLKSLSLDIAWDSGKLKDITEWENVFDPKRENNLRVLDYRCDILTCSFPSHRLVYFGSSDSDINALRARYTSKGEPIGVGQPERFATLKFKALEGQGVFIKAKISSEKSLPVEYRNNSDDGFVNTSFFDGETPRSVREPTVNIKFGGDITACIDDCSTDGAKRCNSTKVPQVCASDVDTDSCLEWKDLPYCNSGEECVFGKCVEKCTQISCITDALIDAFVTQKSSKTTSIRASITNSSSTTLFNAKAVLSHMPEGEGESGTAQQVQTISSLEPGKTVGLKYSMPGKISGNLKLELKNQNNKILSEKIIPTNISPFQNQTNKIDVDNDGRISPIDALVIINYINEGGVGELNYENEQDIRYYYDVDGDFYLAPIDVLGVVNYINEPPLRYSIGGEGEATGYNEKEWHIPKDDYVVFTEETAASDDNKIIITSQKYSEPKEYIFFNIHTQSTLSLQAENVKNNPIQVFLDEQLLLTMQEKQVELIIPIRVLSTGIHTLTATNQTSTAKLTIVSAPIDEFSKFLTERDYSSQAGTYSTPSTIKVLQSIPSGSIVTTDANLNTTISILTNTPLSGVAVITLKNAVTGETLSQTEQAFSFNSSPQEQAIKFTHEQIVQQELEEGMNYVLDIELKDSVGETIYIERDVFGVMEKTQNIAVPEIHFVLLVLTVVVVFVLIILHQRKK